MSVTGRHYKYYDLVMAAFVTVLLCSNLIGPGKTCQLLVLGVPLVFSAGNLFFPISYIFGDVLTEVYGFARTRKVIWAGFGAMIFATIMSNIVLAMPMKPDEPYNVVLQPALEVVFGSTWRIVVASMAAFWVGDFVNGFVLAKMKVLTEGRALWTRTIGSTIFGQAVDSALFYPIAFAGQWETSTLLQAMAFNWFFKVALEVVLTPFTYVIVNGLKKAEDEDFFDRETNFTPFSLQD